MTDLNYTAELKQIENLGDKLEISKDIIRSVDSWLPDLKTFINDDVGLIEDHGRFPYFELY